MHTCNIRLCQFGNKVLLVSVSYRLLRASPTNRIWYLYPWVAVATAVFGLHSMGSMCTGLIPVSPFTHSRIVVRIPCPFSAKFGGRTAE